MHVILCRSIKKLGRVGDIVEVRNGYGRYLVNQAAALRATEGNMRLFEDQKHAIQERSEQAHQLAEHTASCVEGKDFMFIKQASDDGRLFGSLSAKEISKVLSMNGYDVKHYSVVINTPIKSLGIFSVQLALYGDVGASILVNVARSEAEGAEAMNAFREAQAHQEAA